jgi:hypothetical protein
MEILRYTMKLGMSLVWLGLTGQIEKDTVAQSESSSYHLYTVTVLVPQILLPKYRCCPRASTPL